MLSCSCYDLLVLTWSACASMTTLPEHGPLVLTRPPCATMVFLCWHSQIALTWSSHVYKVILSCYDHVALPTVSEGIGAEGITTWMRASLLKASLLEGITAWMNASLLKASLLEGINAEGSTAREHCCLNQMPHRRSTKAGISEHCREAALWQVAGLTLRKSE